MDCPYDPRLHAGAAQGMYHCPSCGEMVIAGMEHTPEWDDEMEAMYAADCLRWWVEATWYQDPDPVAWVDPFGGDAPF